MALISDSSARNQPKLQAIDHEDGASVLRVNLAATVQFGTKLYYLVTDARHAKTCF